MIMIYYEYHKYLEDMIRGYININKYKTGVIQTLICPHAPKASSSGTSAFSQSFSKHCLRRSFGIMWISYIQPGVSIDDRLMS